MEKGKKISVIAIILLILCFVGIALFIYYGRSKEERSKPENTVEAFIVELNHDNIEGMLSYIEPAEAELIRAGMEKMDSFTNSNVMKFMTKWLPFMSYVTKTDVFPELHPEIVSVNEQENTAVVTISLSQDNTLQYYDIYMIQIEDTWYIEYAWKADFTEAT